MEQREIYFRRPHWSVRYLVVVAFEMKDTVPYTVARARMVFGPIGICKGWLEEQLVKLGFGEKV